MSQLAKNIAGSDEFSQAASNDVKAKSPSIDMQKGDLTLKEAFSEINIDWWTLDEALSFLEISVTEFRKKAISNGFCSSKDFDKYQKFPFSLIRALDNGHWMID